MENNSTTTTGYLLIADISGYTAYLAESELGHAQKTLQALLELIIDHTRPPQVLSKLEGDAVFSYVFADQAREGQTFVELIEDTYVAFRRRIELMVLNNTCQCNACANISSLDLKFLVHFGRFAEQRLGDRTELVGTDVNLVHRLLKNSVAEETGVTAYTLYTEAAVQRLGLADVAETMIPHQESYEHIGDVAAWVQDMHPVWQRKKETTRVTIPPDDVAQQLEIEIYMRPELLWDYLAQPEFRSILIGSDRQEIENRQQGRVGPGSVYQCYHGDQVIPETVIEWHPFESMITRDLIPVPVPNTSVLVQYSLEPTAQGTRLRQTFSKAQGPWLGRFLVNRATPRGQEQFQQAMAEFKRSVEADQAQRGELPEAVDVALEVIANAVADSLAR